MLKRRPSGPALCWMMAFFTASYQHLLWTPTQSGFPRAPSPGCGFPYHISSITPAPTLTGTATNLTELYNSSTPTQSPTRMFDRHQAEITVMQFTGHLFSGASVYECTMGIFFTSSHFISQFPPTRFPLITAIRMCHLLPVHHLRMAFFAGSKVKMPQYK